MAFFFSQIGNNNLYGNTGSNGNTGNNLHGKIRKGYLYNGITLLYTWNHYNIVSQLYTPIKTFLKSLGERKTDSWPVTKGQILYDFSDRR